MLPARHDDDDVVAQKTVQYRKVLCQSVKLTLEPLPSKLDFIGVKYGLYCLIKWKGM